jgi:LmbE family N-acetylglucosaminyl deacetylase
VGLGRLLLLFLLIAGCVRNSGPEREEVDVLVIAPHPDDEVLLAAGVLTQAVKEGERVAVALITNGDYTCERNGYTREAETIAALSLLGVKEADVHFLGYPDGAIDKLTPTPLEPRDRMSPEGHCIQAAGTYATRGAGHTDEHALRTGEHAPWTSTALTGDLAALLARLKPREVVLPHGIDSHPDHAATYAYFRRALDQLETGPARVHRGIVHADRCWPTDCRVNFTPDAGFLPLPPPYENYRPRERRPVDAQLKFTAISRYPSQTGPKPQSDWLAGFARTEEDFFPEVLQRIDQKWVRVPVQPPIEFTLSETTVFTVLHAHGGETIEVALTPDRIIIRRVGAVFNVLGSWFRSTPGPLTLRIEARPDDGDVSEWSVLGPEGLIGLRVVSPMVTGVEGITRK